MAIHCAKIENSDRLRRVHSLLCDGGWHGTRKIMHSADVCAVNTVIAELRANGFEIATRCGAGCHIRITPRVARTTEKPKSVHQKRRQSVNISIFQGHFG
ncbi:hypothetical protein DSCW_21160 [Desulfosarcina widdelii]|uniref:Uncharacterized protein n=1 Tax=Desulfosarcina widdelii TaxID=947919 RepID=A0A5K7Z356_9BACT|nr:hypothetical protein [Desulfosarcina widdelii]BBO74699.1 hypothetical protein DSCW_21160 [Desulfosarcina widdelii]